MPLGGRVYIVLTWLVGGSLVLLLLSRVVVEEPWALGLVALATAGLQAFCVVGATEKTSYNIALVGYAIAFTLWGAPQAMLVIIIACTVEWVAHRIPWYIQTFNVAALGVAVTMASVVGMAISRDLPFSEPRRLVGMAAAVLTFEVVNHVLVGVVVFLARGERLAESGVMGLTAVMIDATLLAAGVTVAIAWTVSPLASVLALLPLYLLYSALRIPQIERQASIQLSQDLLIMLAEVVDLRDPFMLGHSQHVAKYSELIAREMGLPDSRIEAIRQAALVHDIGKLGIPEAILLKPTRLDEAESAVMETHPAYGSQLLARSDSLRRLMPVVRHHHERYDGVGYPDGVAGRRIPLEARIIAVADTTDAMASDRAYRKALAPTTILEELRRNAGSQLDPGVVNAFVLLVEREGYSVIVNSASVVLKEGTHKTLRHRAPLQPEALVEPVTSIAGGVPRTIRECSVYDSNPRLTTVD